MEDKRIGKQSVGLVDMREITNKIIKIDAPRNCEKEQLPKARIV